MDKQIQKYELTFKNIYKIITFVSADIRKS